MRRRTTILVTGTILALGFSTALAPDKREKQASTRQGDADAIPGIRGRILVQNNADVPLPDLSVPCGMPGSRRPGYGGDRWPLAKPNAMGTAYEFVIPGKYAVVGYTNHPVPVFPKKEPKGVRFVYEPFLPPRAVLGADLGVEPVTFGLLRTVRVDRVKVEVDQKGHFVAKWDGHNRAAVYMVSLYHWLPYRDEGLPYSIFTCSRSRPEVSVTRLVLARMMKARATHLGPLPGGLSEVKRMLSGEVFEIGCELKVKVRGIDAAGTLVYEASSDVVEYKVTDRAELEIIKPEHLKVSPKKK